MNILLVGSWAEKPYNYVWFKKVKWQKIFV